MEEKENIQNNSQNGLAKVPPRPIPPRPDIPNVQNQNIQTDVQENQTQNDQVKNTGAEKPKKLKKTQKPKKQISKKAKLILIFSIIGFVVLASFVTWLTIFLIEGKKVVLPKNETVSVTQIDDKTFLSFSHIDDAQTYIFKIETDDQSLEIHSKKNTIDVSTYFDMQKTFTISLCAQAKNERSRSAYCSAIEFNNAKKLTAPTISYSQATGLVTFNHVDNAQSYVLHIWSSTGSQSKTFSRTGSTAALFPDLPNGFYSIYVIANSSSKFFTFSDMSNVLDIEIANTPRSPRSANINQNTLTVFLREQCDFVELAVGNQKYKLTVDQTIFNSSSTIFETSFDLSLFSISTQLGTSITVRTITDGSASETVTVQVA